jgi:hypothetical protein
LRQAVDLLLKGLEGVQKVEEVLVVKGWLRLKDWRVEDEET